MVDKKELVRFFLERGILLDPGALEAGVDIDESLLNKAKDAGIMVIGKAEAILLSETIIHASNPPSSPAGIIFTAVPPIQTTHLITPISPQESQKGSVNHEESLESLMQIHRGTVKVLQEYEDLPQKRDVQDFVAYFNVRFKAMERILKNRAELQGSLSINRILQKRDKEAVSTIGLVLDKQETKNGNIVMTIEDPTGEIKVIVSHTKPEVFAHAKDIMLDETIGVVGMSADKAIFAKQFLWPDVPLTRDLKRSPDPGYALFLSDIHIGSKQFLAGKFEKFLQWISGESGSDQQREIANKVQYIFIVGDIIDGVGIYPNQDQDLELDEVHSQYQEAARLFKLIPGRIRIVLCAGNHDAVRLSEPQPVLSKDFAKALWELPNVTMVSNPSWVNIHSSERFSGFDVLLYHGYSMDHYVANSDHLRSQGGYDRPDAIMKFFITRRHLAPTHTSTLYIPDSRHDYLVIEKIPDIFLTGHIHKSAAITYRGITMVCGSCWQAKTAFQDKVGHNPEPGRVPILNLQTRELKVLRF